MNSLGRWVRSPVIWLLAAGLAVSLGSLIISLSENGFSGENLLILFVILRYSTIIVFACSVYIFLKNIYNLIRRKSRVIFCLIKIFLCLILIALCIGILYLEAFIIVFSSGNSVGNPGGIE